MREGIDHPTASQLDRLALCPGSWALCKKAPPEDPTPDASFGTRVHECLAGLRKDEDLTQDERDMVDQCRAEKHRLLAGRVPQVSWVEVRERVEFAGGTLFSGQADYVGVTGHTLVIVDYKTGFDAVPSAEKNLQMRGLAVAFSQRALEFGCIATEVVIVQPRCEPQITRCVYTMEAVDRARVKLREMIMKIAYPDAIRSPGPEQCKYCRAKSICPEAQHGMSQLARINGVDLIPAERVGELLDQCQMAEKVIDAIRRHARQLIESGVEVPGWRLKAGYPREEITNLPLVWSRVYALGISQGEFVGACKLPKTALKQLIRWKIGEVGKAVDITLKSIIQDCVTVSETAPRLEKIK